MSREPPQGPGWPPCHVRHTNDRSGELFFWNAGESSRPRTSSLGQLASSQSAEPSIWVLALAGRRLGCPYRFGDAPKHRRRTNASSRSREESESDTDPVEGQEGKTRFLVKETLGFVQFRFVPTPFGRPSWIPYCHGRAPNVTLSVIAELTSAKLCGCVRSPPHRGEAHAIRGECV